MTDKKEKSETKKGGYEDPYKGKPFAPYVYAACLVIPASMFTEFAGGPYGPHIWSYFFG